MFQKVIYKKKYERTTLEEMRQSLRNYPRKLKWVTMAHRKRKAHQKTFSGGPISYPYE